VLARRVTETVRRDRERARKLRDKNKENITEQQESDVREEDKSPVI
jgi:hypothetical protein